MKTLNGKMHDEIEEIAVGLYADPRTVTKLFHIKPSGRIAIYLGHGSHEKYFSPRKAYTEAEFKAFAERLKNGSSNEEELKALLKEVMEIPDITAPAELWKRMINATSGKALYPVVETVTPEAEPERKLFNPWNVKVQPPRNPR